MMGMDNNPPTKIKIHEYTLIHIHECWDRQQARDPECSHAFPFSVAGRLWPLPTGALLRVVCAAGHLQGWGHVFPTPDNEQACFHLDKSGEHPKLSAPSLEHDPLHTQEST